MGQDKSHGCTVGVDMLLVSLHFILSYINIVIHDVGRGGVGLPRAANWRLLGSGGLRRTQEDSSTSTYLTLAWVYMYVTYFVNYLILEILLGLRGKREKTGTGDKATTHTTPSAAHKCIKINYSDT